MGTGRESLEAVFDSPGLGARLHRGVHGAALRLVSGVLRLAGPGMARRLPSLSAVEVVHVLPGLAPAFHGLRVLHLSDLHLESLPRPDAAIAAALAARWDMLVCTGDVAEGDAAPSRVRRFFEPLGRPGLMPWLAVLGNHDRLSLRPALEGVGFTVLMNAAVPLVRGDSRLWVAGVDDPATFWTADLAGALAAVPPGATTILLAHAPDLAEHAAAVGCALYLCGHTHGGQFVLPGIGPLFYRRRYPPDRIAGAWRAGQMGGYTTTGLGAHHGLVRVGCQPELVVHELRAL